MKSPKGIKKAVTEFNNHYGCASVMYNPTTNEVWCDVFESCNNFKNYSDKLIVKLISKSNIFSNYDITSIVEIKQSIENLED